MGQEPLTVLSAITTNPDRVAQLEEGISRVSIETGNPLSLVATRDPDEKMAALPDTRIFLTYRLSEQEWDAAADLDWIHFGAAGIEHSILPGLLDSNIPITLSKGIHGDVMAQYALWAIISLATGLPLSLDAARKGEWTGREIRPLHHSITGRRLLVVGLGSTGLPAAQLAASVGMHVTGIRRTLNEDPLPEGISALHTLDELDRLLPGTDYMLLTLPNTPLTCGIITGERLRALPEGAGIVNMARGALIDEEALLEVLDEGHLRGAVLDCFSSEPLPRSSPLWNHPGVIVTPHVSGNFNEYTSRVINLFIENLRRFLKGGSLLYHFDRSAGY